MTKLLLPFRGRVKLTSPFGTRDIDGTTDYHRALDLVGLDDTTVCAPCDGVIAASTIITDRTNLTWEWGNYVRLDTADGMRIFMCHLASRAVTAGQRVKAGDVIGVMGSTGYSFGPHTHFEVRNSMNEAVDPCPLLGIKNAVGIYENPAPDDKPSDDPSSESGLNGEEIYRRLTEYINSLPESQWSRDEGYFLAAAEKGSMDGRNPRGFVTREQLAAVLGREGII